MASVIGALGLTALATALLLATGSLRSEKAADAAGPILEVTSTTTGPFEWTPSGMTVLAGSTVRWTVAGPAPHTITSDGCGNAQFGACSFDSPQLQTGTAATSFEFTFDRPGVYSYYCRIHGTPGGIGQAGSIVVYAAGSVPPGPPPGRPELLQPKNTAVGIISPANGATIVGDRVTVQMAVSGATLRPSVAGITDPAFGHHHLFLDTMADTSQEFPRAGTVPGVYHVGEPSLELTGLTPGVHTLALYWGFDNHFSPIQPIGQTIQFTVLPSVRPPATGDGGLAD